jgi:hypothetical protein
VRQFLGQRERIEAAGALMLTLLPAHGGQITDVAGPMIASWSRVSMHKGHITMLRRIRAGSHAIIAHQEAAHALFVAHHPPAVLLSQVIVESGQKVALLSGTSLCVIDRAVNAVVLAWAFAPQGLGWLCLLDRMFTP